MVIMQLTPIAIVRKTAVEISLEVAGDVSGFDVSVRDKMEGSGRVGIKVPFSS